MRLAINLARVRALLARQVKPSNPRAGLGCRVHHRLDIRQRVGNGCEECLADTRELLTVLNEYQKALNHWCRDAVALLLEGKACD